MSSVKKNNISKLTPLKEKCDVTIVIPAFNEEDHIESCIKSILSQNFNEGELEIIVVDGMSEDKTATKIKELSDSLDIRDNRSIKLLENPKKIAASGMNIGLKAGIGDVLFVFSAHAYMKQDFIQKSIDCLRETGSDIAGGIVLSAPDSNTYLSKAIGKALNSKFALGGITARTGRKRRPMENPSFGAYRKEIIEKFGYMDESLKRNTDYEFNIRLHRQGAKITFCPDIKSYYFNRPTLKTLFKQYYDTSFYKAAMIGKYQKVIRLRHLVPPAFFIILFVLLIGGLFSEYSFYGALVLFSLYLLGAIVFSLNKIKYLPVLPICYLTIHFGYAAGFLLGLLSRDKS